VAYASRVPSHILAARAANARRVGEKIKALIEQGFIVYDDDGSVVKKVHLDDGDLAFGYGFSDTTRFMYFINDPELDNGAFDTIPEFNAQFIDWRAVNPADIRRIEL
jgi:hypothetical protein